MQPATRGRSQLTFGLGQEVKARQRAIRLPADLRADWDVVIRAHHNVLLVGKSSATDEMLGAMKPHLREPVQEYIPKVGVSVPRPLKGTLVLSEVARLDLKQQTELLQWLDQFPKPVHVQIISTTCMPLFSLVEMGAFLADLYYRLNVVLIDLTASGEATL